MLDLPGLAAVDTASRGRLVGVATWSIERAELACLGVVPEVRRAGVGSLLVGAAKFRAHGQAGQRPIVTREE